MYSNLWSTSGAICCFQSLDSNKLSILYLSKSEIFNNLLRLIFNYTPKKNILIWKISVQKNVSWKI